MPPEGDATCDACNLCSLASSLRLVREKKKIRACRSVAVKELYGGKGDCSRLPTLKLTLEVVSKACRGVADIGTERLGENGGAMNQRNKYGFCLAMIAPLLVALSVGGIRFFRPAGPPEITPS